MEQLVSIPLTYLLGVKIEVAAYGGSKWLTAKVLSTTVPLMPRIEGGPSNVRVTLQTSEGDIAFGGQQITHGVAEALLSREVAERSYREIIGIPEDEVVDQTTIHQPVRKIAIPQD